MLTMISTGIKCLAGAEAQVQVKATEMSKWLQRSHEAERVRAQAGQADVRNVICARNITSKQCEDDAMLTLLFLALLDRLARCPRLLLLWCLRGSQCRPLSLLPLQYLGTFARHTATSFLAIFTFRSMSAAHWRLSVSHRLLLSLLTHSGTLPDMCPTRK